MTAPPPARLCLPRPLQASTLRCACAVALVALLVLLQQPDAAVGQELQVQQPLWPRAASWLPSFSHLNKYFEKLFGSR